MTALVYSVVLGLLVVSLVICWVLTQGLGEDGRKTYSRTFWQYDESAKFDNQWPTWLTDYALTFGGCYQVFRLRRSAPASPLRTRVSALLLFYAASTLVGGVTHAQYNGEYQELNSVAFRAAWTTVVGITAASGAILGLIASELLRLQAVENPRPPLSMVALRLPDASWLMWGTVLVTLSALGTFSHSRPACDIFVAGCSQVIPTFYLNLVLVSFRDVLDPSMFWAAEVGLLSNSPLIFIYPWLIQHSGMSLGAVNAFLHTVLAVSWGLQGLSLSHACAVYGRRSATLGKGALS